MRLLWIAPVFCLAASPLEAATLTLVLENASEKPAATAEGAGFIGAPRPPLPSQIAPGERFETRVPSPYPTSAGASFRIGPADAPRACFVTIARLREGLSGPWRRPTIVIREDARVSCAGEVVLAEPGGDFAVVVRID